MDDKWETIHQIREFNRFYTVLLGFLDRNYLRSGYSVTEMRILFELYNNRCLSANQLIELLHLDKGYVSRIIRSFEQRGLLTRQTAPDDRRARTIQLTAKGLEETEALIDITNRDIRRLIEGLEPEACGDLCRSMRTIMAVFSEPNHCEEEVHET